MLNNSQDVFYIMLAFGTLWISVGLFWVFWYTGRILKEFFILIRSFRERMEKLDAFFDLFKKKLESSSYHLTLLAEGMRKLVEVYHRKTLRNKKKESRDEVSE